MRVAAKVMVMDEHRKTLEHWARGRSTPVRLMQRAKIVLLAADGLENKDIGPLVGVTRQTSARWRDRYVALGLEGLKQDAPGRGRKATRRAAMEAKILHATTQTQPEAATHWSTRTMAEAVGTSHTMVNRVWRDHKIKPHLWRTFKLSNDPRFVEKPVDVVGLYLNPPEHALVFSCDEKSQIQALDRSQPGLPIKPGRCGTMRTTTNATARRRCSRP